MRLVTVVLASLFVNGVAFAHAPAPGMPRTPEAPPLAGDAWEVRRVVDPGGPRLGVEAIELTPELQEHFGADGLGVLVARVVDGSAAAAAGVRVGDVVVSVGGEPVATVWELRGAVQGADQDVAVEVLRAGRIVELEAHLQAGVTAFDFPPYVDEDLQRELERSFEDDFRRADDDRAEQFDQLERHLEDLEDRLESEFESMQDRLDALEDREPGRSGLR